MNRTIVNGSVAGLHRWPVKSLGGETVQALRIDERGAGGDRTHALWDTGRERLLTARQAPGLLRWHASYPEHPDAAVDPADPPLPRVLGPDGTMRTWGDPALTAAIGADIGFAVRATRDVRGQQDLGGTLLLTTRASLDALAAELGTDLDLRRFRTNIHADLDADAFAEAAYEGAVVRVGRSWMRALHPCVRCVIPTRDPESGERDPRILRHLAREHETLFGINLRPLGPAIIHVGDEIEIRTGDQQP